MRNVVTCANELAFEGTVRNLIAMNVCGVDPTIRLFDHKTVGDIILTREGASPAIFFLEAKYFQLQKGRLGFGNNTGAGIQPEILKKRPAYLEHHLRWVIGSDHHKGKGYWLVPSEMLCKYVAGGVIGQKQNNIKEALFREVPSLDEQGFVRELQAWLRI